MMDFIHACKKNYKISYFIVAYIIPILLLIILGLWFINENTMIKIVGDEYGYWAAGAYISGLDWSEITSYNSYYGYGYGFFVAILLKCNLSAVLIYRLAIFLNILFLISIYVIVYYLVRNWTERYNFSFVLQVFLAFSVTVYSGNISYTQYTMPEILIALIYWLQILIVWKMLKQLNFLNSFLFILLNLYAFSVHQRMIGVCLISVCLWLAIAIRSKKSKSFYFSSIISCLCIFIFILILKEHYQMAFFAGGKGKNLAVNDFAGQTSKLESLLSIQGLWMFVKSFAGKIYYLLSTSYLLAGIAGGLGLVCTGNAIRNRIKEKKEINEGTILLVFLVLNTLIMIAISSLTMMEYYGRFDMLFYGRYFEFTISPLILISLIYLLGENNKHKIRIILGTIFSYIVVSCAMEYIIDYSRSASNTFINCVGMASVLIRREYKKFSLIYIALKTVVIGLCLIAMSYVKGKAKKGVRIFGLSMFIIINIFVYLYVYEKGCLSWAVTQSNSELKLAKKIEDLGASDSLYYYIIENDLKADYLQFLLKDHTIHILENPDEIHELKSNDYILTIPDTSIKMDLDEQGYEAYAESEGLILWRKE